MTATSPGSSFSAVRLAATLARRDLRGGLSRLGVFVAALALGVGAIAAVGSLSATFLEGLAKESRRILGGDLEITITHGAAPAALLETLSSMGRVSAIADAQVMAEAPSTGARTVVQLKGADSAYPLIGRVTVEAADASRRALDAAAFQDALGESADGRPGAVVDAALLARLDLAIGDVLAIGGLSLEVRGVLAEEPDRAAAGFMLGPRVLTSLQAAQGTGLLSAGSLVDRSYRVALSDAAADPQAALGAARAAHPDLVWRQRTASEASDTLGDFLERLTLFLTVAGLASLLVGGVGAADAMRAHMRRKTTTIAVFKALGAPAHLVQSTYLLQCGALAVLAAGAGVALGAAAPFFAAWAFGDRLPFPAALGVYPGPLLRAVGFGAVVAIAFTARPLAAARRIPAARLLRAFGLRDARPERTAPIVTALCAAALLLLSFTLTDDYVLVVVFFAAAVGAAVALAAASAGLVWLLRRLRPPRDAALRLAHANLVGPNSHARSVTMSLGLGLTLLGAVSAIDANISRQVSEVFPSTAPSLWFADIPPDAVDRFDALLGEGPGSDYERWPMLRAGVAALGGVPVSEAPGAQGSAWVREGDWGVTYSAAPFEGDTLISGAWWPADYAGPPLLSLEADQAERFELGVGDTMTLTISGRDVTAEIANVREIDWSGGGLNFVAVFAPGALEAAGPSHVGGVRAATIAEEEAIFRSVTAAFPGVTIIRTREALTAVTDVLANVGLAVRAMSAVVVASGALVLIGAVGATLQARLRASMVMKAVGARRSHIVKALAAEYLVLGLAPALLAFVFALAAAYGVVAGPMDMDWQAPMGALGGLILAGAALTLGVGLGAMSRILAAAPWPVLRSP